jgi:hypothetical protein
MRWNVEARDLRWAEAYWDEGQIKRKGKNGLDLVIPITSAIREISLIGAVRRTWAGLPAGAANRRFTMADIGMAAFSLFFMQSPSFLAHQRRLLEDEGRSNCQTLFKMADIPCNNQVRVVLDGRSRRCSTPRSKRFSARCKLRAVSSAFVRLGNHVLTERCKIAAAATIWTRSQCRRVSARCSHE